ncbi:MAG: Mur ligase family protein, partial [Candidatus Rokuibacteriota bacterium]
MAQRLRGPGVLLGTPLGRRHLRNGLCHRSGPLVLGAAGVYRRVFLRRTRIVAVVGSFGKTTTTRAVLSALGGSPAGPVGANSGGWIALALFRLRPGTRHGVIEVGINGPGQMARYASVIRPDISVVMSVGSEHRRSLK